MKSELELTAEFAVGECEDGPIKICVCSSDIAIYKDQAVVTLSHSDFKRAAGQLSVFIQMVSLAEQDQRDQLNQPWK